MGHGGCRSRAACTASRRSARSRRWSAQNRKIGATHAGHILLLDMDLVRPQRGRARDGPQGLQRHRGSYCRAGVLALCSVCRPGGRFALQVGHVLDHAVGNLRVERRYFFWFLRHKFPMHHGPAHDDRFVDRCFGWAPSAWAAISRIGRIGRTSMLPTCAGGIFAASWIASFRSLASMR